MSRVNLRRLLTASRRARSASRPDAPSSSWNWVSVMIFVSTSSLRSRAELQSTEQVRGLVERAVAGGRIERAVNFGGGVVALVPDTIDEEIDRFCGDHCPMWN